MNNISESFLKNIHKTSLQLAALSTIETMSPVLQIVEEFFKKKDIVVYGGMAMNLYLPTKKQFYTKYDIPDYDGFCSHAKQLSLELIHEIKAKKYKYITVKYAIHEGTFKISWEFKDIVDFSSLSQDEYKELVSKSKLMDNGLRLCPMYILKANAYKELSMPKSALFRWSKVYARLKILEEEYVTKQYISNDKLVYTQSLPTRIKDCLDMILQYVKNTKLPLTGNIAIKKYLNLDGKYFTISDKFRFVQVLSDNMYSVLSDIKLLLSGYDDIRYIINKKYIGSAFFPMRLSIDVDYKGKQYRLLSILDAKNHCYGISELNRNVYVSKFFLIYTLYFHLYKHSDKTILSKKLKSVINMLLKKISENDFGTSCYGYEKTLSAVKKSRMNKNFQEVLYKNTV